MYRSVGFVAILNRKILLDTEKFRAQNLAHNSRQSTFTRKFFPVVREIDSSIARGPPGFNFA